MKSHALETKTCFIGLLVSCLVLLTSGVLQAQVAGSVFYLPVIQSKEMAELGLAFSNPTLTPASVTLTARTYSRALITGADIVNPVTITLPASGQRSLKAVEAFGTEIAGKSGWVEGQFSTAAVKG